MSGVGDVAVLPRLVPGLSKHLERLGCIQHNDVALAHEETSAESRLVRNTGSQRGARLIAGWSCERMMAVSTADILFCRIGSALPHSLRYVAIDRANKGKVSPAVC